LLLVAFPGHLLAADDEEAEAPPEKNPSYVSLGAKPMILNLFNDGGRLSFLQVKADVLVGDDDAKEAVEAHIPAIRHQLILSLSEQDAAAMKSPVQREEVRQKLTEEVRAVIKELADNNDVDEVLFSTFLVQ
jgi:flagellar FliL protein